MKGNKHAEFLRSIRLTTEEKTKRKERPRKTGTNPIHRMTSQERMKLEKDLERRFDELFGPAEED